VVDSQRGLIRCPDNDVEDEVAKQRRTKSADLLKKELEKHGRSGSREYLAKVRSPLTLPAHPKIKKWPLKYVVKHFEMMLFPFWLLSSF